MQPGDGVCFDEGHPEQDEQGGRVVEVRNGESGMGNGGKLSWATHLEVRLLEGSVNLAAMTVGCLVWKTDDPEFRREMDTIVCARCGRAS